MCGVAPTSVVFARRREVRMVPVDRGVAMITLNRETLKAALPRRGVTAGGTTGTITSLMRTKGHMIVSRDGNPRIKVVRATVGRFNGARPSCAFTPVSMYSTVDRNCVKCSLRATVHTRLVSHNVCGPMTAVLARIIVSPCSSTFTRPRGVVKHILARRRTRARRGGKGFIAGLTSNACGEVLTTPGPRGVMRLRAVHALMSTNRMMVTTNNNKVPIVRRKVSLRNTDTVVRGSLSDKLLTRRLGTSALLVLADIRGMDLGLNRSGRRCLGAVSMSSTGGCVTSGRFTPNSVLPGFRTKVSFVRGKSGEEAVVASVTRTGSKCFRGAKAVVG